MRACRLAAPVRIAATTASTPRRLRALPGAGPRGPRRARRSPAGPRPTTSRRRRRRQRRRCPPRLEAIAGRKLAGDSGLLHGTTTAVAGRSCSKGAGAGPGPALAAAAALRDGEDGMAGSGPGSSDSAPAGPMASTVVLTSATGLPLPLREHPQRALEQRREEAARVESQLRHGGLGLGARDAVGKGPYVGRHQQHLVAHGQQAAAAADGGAGRKGRNHLGRRDAQRCERAERSDDLLAEVRLEGLRQRRVDHEARVVDAQEAEGRGDDEAAVDRAGLLRRARGRGRRGRGGLWAGRAGEGGVGAGRRGRQRGGLCQGNGRGAGRGR